MTPAVLIDQAIFRNCSSSLACEGCGEASRTLPERVFSRASSKASKRAPLTQTPMNTIAGSVTIQKIKFNINPHSMSFIWEISPPSCPLHLGERCVAFDARFSKNGGDEVRPPRQRQQAHDAKAKENV